MLIEGKTVELKREYVEDIKNIMAKPKHIPMGQSGCLSWTTVML